MVTMENDIIIYATGYLTARLMILLAFGYALLRGLRPTRARARSTDGRMSAIRRSNLVRDDQC